MIVAIHQPQYLPYIGFFDKMNKADVFVLLDTVQFKKNEWQNRNRIKTAQNWQWLTVPVLHHFGQKICDVKICSSSNWRKKHVHAFISNYAKAAHFKTYWPYIEDIYNITWEFLSNLNIYWIKKIRQFLQIDTPIYLSSRLGELPEEPDERIIHIVKYFEADTYLSGIGGANYMNLNKYNEENINVTFQQFLHPTYPQQFNNFEANLSIIDLLFNCGDRSYLYLNKVAIQPLRHKDSKMMNEL